MFHWKGCWLALVVIPTFFCSRLQTQAQQATIADAWWNYQQDCNGDGCLAGVLPANAARLSWNVDLIDCNGSVTVFEILYQKACASGLWTALYTNAAHAVVGCRSSDLQYLDVTLGSNCACRDYKIEVYRLGQAEPDDIRSAANDPDLNHHQEQSLAEDFCLSDNFDTCTSLNGVKGSQAEDNSLASRETGEPPHAGHEAGKSLWYCWTATNATPVTFDTVGSSFDTLLAVYLGNSVSNLSLVAENDDISGADNRQSRVSFTPTPGTTYHIAVDGYGGASGLAVLNWNQVGVALPDLIMWGPAVSATVITRSFASDDCEVLEGCASPGTHRLLSFTTETRNIGTGDLMLGNPATNELFHYASCHGHYHFEDFAQYDLLATNGDLVASGHKVGFCLLDDHPWSATANPQAKYSCGDQGIQVGWGDVYQAGLPCQFIDVTGVTPGDYFLRLIVNPAGLLPESETNNNVTLVAVSIPPASCSTVPTNDNFASGMRLFDHSPPVLQFSQCTTREDGEPAHGGNGGGHSLWYVWTPSSNQPALITTKGSDFNTLLGVYTGSQVGFLAPVASNDDVVPGSFFQSQVSFPATAGTTYHIAVDGYNQQVGMVVLNLNPPRNDDFDSSFVIAGSTGTTNGTTIGASKEPYELAHAFDVGGHSVWYRWSAPQSGPVNFDTLHSGYNTTLAIYTGTAVTNLTPVASNNNDSGGTLTSRVGFSALAGTIYHIAVDGSTGDAGELVLSWNMGSHLEITRGSGGLVQVNFSGVKNQRYGLLSSTNFTTWSTQTTRTMSGGLQSYSEAASQSRQFYQTILVP
jgi:hypothetical protein